jgi:cytochrome oxidase Cu insertion factor (SCO1/SenC/PrrC family)
VIAQILGTIIIGLLLAIAVALPSIPGMQRGSDPEIRADVSEAAGAPGEALPDFTLYDFDGAPVRLADFRGQRVLLMFERSIDW